MYLSQSITVTVREEAYVTYSTSLSGCQVRVEGLLSSENCEEEAFMTLETASRLAAATSRSSPA